MNDEKLFYRPLPPNHIRLLRLRSSKELSFDLFHADLRKKAVYAALSYTWGNNQLCRQIVVNGRPFLITENLHLALQHFHHGVSCKDTLFPLKTAFWIDAISINQSTSPDALRERCAQVQMMTEIFVRAERVFIWLGLPKNVHQNRAACEKLRLSEDQLYQDMHKALGGYRPWWWPHKPMDAHESESQTAFHIAKADADRWTEAKVAWLGIFHLWSAPWWARSWALQEGSVPEDISRIFIKGIQTPRAKMGTVLFVCGDAYTTWNRLILSTNAWARLLQYAVAKEDAMSASPKRMLRLHTIKRKRVTTQATSGVDAINLFRMSSCQDPRDKIYAARGLMPKADGDNILPDYQTPVIEVYTKFAEGLIQSPSIALDLLGYTCKVHNALEVLPTQYEWSRLPSWVPNWYLAVEIDPLPKTIYIQRPASSPHRKTTFVDRRGIATVIHTIRSERAYNACGSKSTPEVLVVDGELHISGVIVDSIAETMRFQWQLAARKAMLSSWKSHLASTRYPTGFDFDTALRRTRCADVEFLSHSPIPVSRGYEVDYSIDSLHAVGETLPSSETSQQANKRASMYIVANQRALGLTANDRLALVPYTSEPGDRVCILFGGQVLYMY